MSIYGAGGIRGSSHKRPVCSFPPPPISCSPKDCVSNKATRRSAKKRSQFRIGRLTLVSRTRALCVARHILCRIFCSKACALKFLQQRSGSNPPLQGHGVLHSYPVRDSTKLQSQKSKGFLTTEQGGFEPPVPCGTTVFKTASFNHSDIAPIIQ